MSGGTEPAGAGVLFREAARTYRAYPALFLSLAAAVIVPYRAIAFAIGSADDGGNIAFSIALAGVNLADFFLVGPLVSALHVHAVVAIRAGEQPDPRTIASRGLAALPTAGLAAGFAGLASLFALSFLIVPGVLLMVRWFVVAQVAAVEREGARSALRRSADLARGNFGHVLLFALAVVLITFGPEALLRFGLGLDRESVVSSLASVAIAIPVVSFTALATALLYFDLRFRLRPEATGAAPQQSSWDRRAYSDEDRPAGWYVDPEEPDRMGYWNADETPGWIGEARTPRKVRRAWRAELPDS